MKIFAAGFSLFVLTLGIGADVQAQSFEETWLEFLAEDKVSNISVLRRPDKRTDQQDYLKYLLMNTNSDFCQSDVADAEKLMAEMDLYDEELQKSVPGFWRKLTDLKAKVKAYHAVDAYWTKFLKGEVVTPDQLAAIEFADRLCEKQTAAKLNYMVAYYKVCSGEFEDAKRIFEKRTLQLAEKTSLKVEDVEGLAPRVKKMKAYFQVLPALNKAWADYLVNEESAGFERELPEFPCNPMPNIKRSLLRGLADVCRVGEEELAKIRTYTADESLILGRDIELTIDEFAAKVEAVSSRQQVLDSAWTAFLPESEPDVSIRYGYEYCDSESLIKAYLMDGYSFVCGLAESNLERIDSIRRADPMRLPKEVSTKIKELKQLREQYDANGKRIEQVWEFFVVNGDQLLDNYESTNDYCDNVQQVKDWTMRGLTTDCKYALDYLEQIEAFNEKFDFKFYEDLECRVQRLRLRIWQCRFDVVDELARLEAEQSSYEQRLAELKEEYGVGERPEGCSGVAAAK